MNEHGNYDRRRSDYFQELRQRVHAALYPKVADSDFYLAIAPLNDEPDAKYCLELGMAIMLDKPLLILVGKNRTIPDHLRRVADKIIEADDPSQAADAIQAAMLEWDAEHAG
jgi:hypothetical protein